MRVGVPTFFIYYHKYSFLMNGHKWFNNTNGLIFIFLRTSCLNNLLGKKYLKRNTWNKILNFWEVWKVKMNFHKIISIVQLCVVFIFQANGRGPFFKPGLTLLKCTEFCEQKNLPLHYSNKEKSCCCKSHLNPEPGYIVIWDEGITVYF